MNTYGGIRNLWRTGGECGSAAIEFGLLAPLLVIFAVGTLDIGTAAYRAMQVQAAAEAGAFYVSESGFDAAGITSAVTSAINSNPRITATPAPSVFRACPTASGLIEQACTSTCTCADGSAPGQYARINAQMITDPPILPELHLSTTISGEAIIRIN
jgi:Flp pilus assembly protein TadG